MSYVELWGRALPVTRVHRAAVWDTVQFALNGIMLVLLGEQLPAVLQRAALSVEQSGHQSPWWLVAYALAITFGLVLLRLIWVSASLGVSLAGAHWHGTQRARPPWRLVAALSLAGVRGAITMAGVMTLPLLLPDGTAFPARDLTIFLAAAVILLSLSIAAIGLPRLLKGLQLPIEPAERQEEDRARREAAAAAIVAVDKARRDLPHEASDTEVYTNAAARVIALYQRRLDGSDSSNIDAAQLRKIDETERVLRLAALRAEREKLFDMARHYQLSDETSRKLVREVDLMETRYR